MYHLRPSIFLLSISSVLCSILEGCTITEPLRTEPFERGVIVIEAGQSGKQNASISFISPDKGISTDIFNIVNNRFIGDALKSYTEIDGKGYLLVSNSDKVEVVESSTFRSIAFINKDVEQCRYMVAAPPQNGFLLKGYVSYWGGKTMAPGVAIVSLADRKVINHITVGTGPEQMVVVGDQLFVANSGGQTIGNTVSVVNTSTDQVVTTIQVGDVPTSVVYDSTTGTVCVLCTGRSTRLNANGTTISELVRINPATRQIVSRITIGGRPITGNPTNLVLHAESQTFYFLFKGAIYSFPSNATSISVDKPLVNQSFSGLGVEPTSGIIYGGFARDSVSRGIVRRFRPTGTFIDSVSVGYVPSGFYFK